MKSKKEIRKEILIKRDSIPEALRGLKSRIIMRRVMETEAYKRAKAVLAYVSYGSEVETRELIQVCLEKQKRVFVPRVCEDVMRFFEIRSLDELSIGYKGIPEPKEDPEREYTAEWIQTQNWDETHDVLLLMPGVVFDKAGNRIGYGKGFYDRFLSRGFSGTRIAIAYTLQVLSTGSFETEATDRKPDRLITETEHLAIHDEKAEQLRFERLERILKYKAHRVKVYEDVYRRPDQEVVRYDYVENRNGSGVLLVDEEGKLLFVKQYRITLDRVDLEIPAGCQDAPEEAYELAALREAEEETGLIPEQLYLVSKIIAAVGLFSESTAVYIGTKLKKGKLKRDEDEFIDIVRLTLDEALSRVFDGTIVDGKTIIAILGYQELIRSHKI